MARQRQIVIDQDEDIVSYEHSLSGKLVHVLVGIGKSIPGGGFIVSESQNYENFLIQGDDYDSLMAATQTKPQGVFRKDDLWPYIDSERSKVTSKRESIIESVMGSKK